MTCESDGELPGMAFARHGSSHAAGQRRTSAEASPAVRLRGAQAPFAPAPSQRAREHEPTAPEPAGRSACRRPSLSASVTCNRHLPSLPNTTVGRAVTKSRQPADRDVSRCSAKRRASRVSRKSRRSAPILLLEGRVEIGGILEHHYGHAQQRVVLRTNPPECQAVCCPPPGVQARCVK